MPKTKIQKPTLKEKLSSAQKRSLIEDYYKIGSECGYDMSNVFGYSLSKFDYPRLFEFILRTDDEYCTMSGESFFENKEPIYIN